MKPMVELVRRGVAFVLLVAFFESITATPANAACFLCFFDGNDNSWCVTADNHRSGTMQCQDEFIGGHWKCVLSGDLCGLTILDDIAVDGSVSGHFDLVRASQGGDQSSRLAVDEEPEYFRDCKGAVVARSISAEVAAAIDATPAQVAL